MEVAVATPKPVSFEELFNEYLKVFTLDPDVPDKSQERMVAYVSQPKLKKKWKWSQAKVFLMTHRYRSWDDAYLFFERVYRSIDNGTSLNLKKRKPLKKKKKKKKAPFEKKKKSTQLIHIC